MINTHSFRAYGITKLSRHDPNFAKKIAGQKGYLDQYDRITDEEKLNLYMKYEEDLAIDNSAKKQAELDKEREKRKEIEKQLEQNILAQDEVYRLGKVTENMQQQIDELKKEK